MHDQGCNMHDQGCNMHDQGCNMHDQVCHIHDHSAVFVCVSFALTQVLIQLKFTFVTGGMGVVRWDGCGQVGWVGWV